MSKSLSEILKNTVDYLKFQRDYGNLYFYDEKIVVSDNDNLIFKTETTNETVKPKKSEASFVKESNNSVKSAELWQKAKNIDELNSLICNCKKCILGNLRNNFVFGTGNPEARVVVVGEAPGGDEDREGKPFVGRAGKKLTEILAAIKFAREDVFICNILKCRPPDNRNPLPDEIQKCEPYLFKQLELIKPSLILALGTFAAQTLLKTSLPLGKLRGTFHDFEINGNKIKLLVTFHPAALLRNPNWRRPTWEDVQMFRKEYDLIYSK
ncbi:MAG TPA: uracil-DNA glycosylase [Ignavibacteria bacterium]